MTIGWLGVYLLKASILLILLYIFNKFLLGRETLHRLNRALWLATVVISFTLPLLPMEMGEWGSQVVASGGSALWLEGVEEVTLEADLTQGTLLLEKVVKSLFWIYLCGAIALLIYHLVAYGSIVRQISRYKNQDFGAFKELFGLCEAEIGICRKIHYVVHDKDIAPFSWLNFVVLSREDLTTNGREIVNHELSHTKQNHSWDLFLINAATIILWFNPAVWLTKQALQQVHEYCADDAVLTAGVNAKEYQLLLIKKAAGPRLYSMANSLNHSNLKNRITMMTKKKSQKGVAAKCLYVLPLSLAIMALFATPIIANTSKAIQSVTLTEQEQKQTKDTVKVIGYGVKDKETGTVGEILQVRSIDGSAFVVSGNMEDHKILNIVDGKIWEGDIRELSADDIASISVIKGGHESYHKLPYWDDKHKCEDYNGVIVITSK